MTASPPAYPLPVLGMRMTFSQPSSIGYASLIRS